MGIRSAGNIRIINRGKAATVISIMPETTAKISDRIIPVVFSSDVTGCKAGSSEQIQRIYQDYYPGPFDAEPYLNAFAAALGMKLRADGPSTIVDGHGLTSEDFDLMQQNLSKIGDKKSKSTLEFIYGGVELFFNGSNPNHIQTTLYCDLQDMEFSALLDLEKLEDGSIEAKYVRDPDRGMTAPVEKFMRLGIWALIANPGLLLGMSKL